MQYFFDGEKSHAYGDDANSPRVVYSGTEHYLLSRHGGSRSGNGDLIAKIRRLWDPHLRRTLGTSLGSSTLARGELIARGDIPPYPGEAYFPYALRDRNLHRSRHTSVYRQWAQFVDSYSTKSGFMDPCMAHGLADLMPATHSSVGAGTDADAVPPMPEPFWIKRDDEQSGKTNVMKVDRGQYDLAAIREFVGVSPFFFQAHK